MLQSLERFNPSRSDLVISNEVAVSYWSMAIHRSTPENLRRRGYFVRIADALTMPGNPP